MVPIYFLLVSLLWISRIFITDKYSVPAAVSVQTNDCSRQSAMNGSYFNLSMFNEKRWRQLRQKFRFINTKLWSDLHLQLARSKSSLIFSCHWSCGGLGDRLRGIISGYFLSLLTGRRFMIDMSNPCNLTRFLLPNHYDWTLQRQARKSNRSSLRVPVVDRQNMIPIFSETPFHLNWSSYDQIEFSSNMDILTPLFSNPWLNNSAIIRTILEEIPVEKAHLNTLFPLLYEFLFKPTVEVTRVIDGLLAGLAPKHDHLVCFHARVGKNPSNPKDGNMADSKNILEEMIKFGKNSLASTNLHSIILVASDSSDVVLKILEHFPLRSFTVPGPILHIDRWSQDDDLCAGFLKVVVEFYLLGECRISLISNSGFSAFANRRRLNPYENLYLYKASERRIVSCDNLFLTVKWEPEEAISSKVFCPSGTRPPRNGSLP